MGMTGLHPGTPRRAVVVLLAAVLATAVGGAAVATLTTGPSRSPQPAYAQVRETEGPEREVREAVSAGLGRSVPTRITIPAIGVDARIRAVELVDGELAAPPEASLAGWYERGTSPGELGSAVIVGRADPAGPPGARSGSPAASGQAVFARLSRLVPGDAIEVVREDGVIASFTVDRVAGRSRRDPVSDTGDEAQLRLVPKYRAAAAAAGQVIVFATLGR